MSGQTSAVRELVRGPASDEEIVERVLAGAVDLFEVLMRRHNQRVYRTVRAVLRNEADVEEVMQQSYVSAYAHLAEFKGTARFSTWLLRIALHEAFGRVRRGRLVAVGETEESAIPMWSAQHPQGPEDSVSDRELADWLEAEVEKLPEIHRLTFMLREVEGLDTAQTAEVLEVSELVVKTRLHRAKTALREQFVSRMERIHGEAFAFHAVRCDRVVAAVLAAISLAPRPGVA